GGRFVLLAPGRIFRLSSGCGFCKGEGGRPAEQQAREAGPGTQSGRRGADHRCSFLGDRSHCWFCSPLVSKERGERQSAARVMMWLGKPSTQPQHSESLNESL